MARLTGSRATAGLSVLLLAATLSAQTTDDAATPNRVSKVRIVRLSQIIGEVRLDRDTGRGFEPAIANMPIVEKCRIQTGRGVAEVEFEDNSTLRLAPDSLVEFPQLERLQGGRTASSARLVKGMAYVSLMKSPGNEFRILFGDRTVQLPPAAHIRLQVDGAEAKLAVLGGSLLLDGSAGATEVPRKRTVTFNLQDQAQPAVAKDIASTLYDSWDKDATGYHERRANLSGMSGSPYAYGLTDMSYYGSFMNMGGCGSMWRPYFASAAWDPYSNGVWAWYSGAGYSWVSPYPWGWTPYHYGSWSYCQGAGWGWLPGGSWYGLNNAMAFGTGSGPGSVPFRPKNPPRLGEGTLTAVNMRPLVHSGAIPTGSFVFRRDSAGMGIPRDGMGKLTGFSHRADAQGTATTPIYFSAPPSAGANRPSASAGLGAGSIHRGYAPAGAGMAAPAQNGSMGGRGGGASSPRPMPMPSRPQTGHPH